jgi:hypothetical protein
MEVAIERDVENGFERQFLIPIAGHDCALNTDFSSGVLNCTPRRVVTSPCWMFQSAAPYIQT